MQLSVAVYLYISLSKGANQLQVLYRRLWETFKETSCMESFSPEATVLKCIPSNFFMEICRGFRAISRKLVLENYVLAYHTADKDQAEILHCLSYFLCRLFASYVNRNHKDTTHP